jgi:hypothetical protein
MKIANLRTNPANSYLYEGLDTVNQRKSMMLWESAGFVLKEYALTADQITKLFQEIEKGQTAQGGNRTLLGLAKDDAAAVMRAYNDLKTKVANSGPVKGIDALYDQAAAKLKQATGGDQGVMQYVQKYRDFAKKHPIAQSLIYGALISAAGISGAGLGGAAALGLFKMVDKLLQGEKFSSAAWSGAKTGAMAYGASKLGDYLKGQKAPPGADAAASAAGNVNSMTVAKGALDIFKEKVANGLVTDHNSYVRALQDSLTQAGGDQLKSASYQAAQMSLEMSIKGAATRAAGGEFSGSNTDWLAQTIKAFGGTVDPAALAKDAAATAAQGQFESRTYTPEQVQALFEHVVIAQKLSIQLQEGIWDDIKSGASKGLQGIKSLAGKAVGAVAQKAQTVGHNITTKITADKLMKAWKSAGSPTDSEQLQKLLVQQGVDAGVVNGSMQAVAAGAAQQTQPLQAIPGFENIDKLTPQQLQGLLKQINDYEAQQQAAQQKQAEPADNATVDRKSPLADLDLAEYKQFKLQVKALI